MERLLLGLLVAAACIVGRAGAPEPDAAVGRASASGTARASAPGAAPADAAPADAAAVATLDACPDAPETANGFEDADGCPDAVPPELAAITGVVEGITFRPDKDEFDPDASRPTLDRMVEVLARFPTVEVEIGVHSGDPPGEGPYGRCLTCRRAEAIVRYLIAHGIDRARLSGKGHRSERPIASFHTEEGRRRNRRIELSLKGAPVCVDRRTRRRPDGSSEDCYPYVCRAGECLKRCAAMTDCAGAHDRSEFPAFGWPLECMPGGECTPMPPDKVN